MERDDPLLTIPAPSELGGVDEIVKIYSKDVHFKFKRLKEYSPGKSWILMVYGPSKTGKTFFAGTSGPRTAIVNTGEGLETLLSFSFTSKYPQSKDMIVVDIRDSNPKGIAEAFDATCDAVEALLKYHSDKFDTLVLDEATGFRKFAFNKAMELNTEARTRTKRGNRMEEFVQIDIQDYKIEMDMVEWFLGQYIPKFKEANKHFVMLAHERQVFGKAKEIGGEQELRRVMPGFTGKTFPDKVPSFFDDVWHSEVVANAAGLTMYRLRTGGDEIQIGGSRHGGIFDSVERNPDFHTLLNKIKNSYNKTK